MSFTVKIDGLKIKLGIGQLDFQIEKVYDSTVGDISYGLA